MPLYCYECKQCGNTFDRVVPLEKYKEKQDCPRCGRQSEKLMSIGGIQDDHPVWLDDSVIKQLQDTDIPETRIITSRTEYNKHLKDNGIAAA